MAEHGHTCACCGTANEADARFCEGCGGSLARSCTTCGLQASATARFCRGCGAPLDDQVTPTPDGSVAGPVRKTVSVMFADLAGSTTFEEMVDAETAREVVGHYHELLRSTAQHHRAGITKYIGDGFMAVWGVPEIGADDATHAVNAAVDLQERFVDLAAAVAQTHGAELALRVAVNTGEVVVGAGDADLVGDALNVGARLEAECPRGHVVVGEETWRSTRGRYVFESLGQVQVKGRTAPVAVYQWRGHQAEAADATPFVGRADDVRRLQTVFSDVIVARAARLVTVIGDPGVGKSRLAAEFTAVQRDTRVILARCDVEATVALAPLVEVLRTSDLESDIRPAVPERDRLLRALDGLTSGVAGSVEENFWALRRYIELAASSEPMVLVLDDIQWADSLLLDFIEHLIEWVRDVPVLVLALARPELREIRPDLVTVSRWVSEAIQLSGLDAGATANLAAKVLGAGRLPEDLLNRLPASTGGNPLFVRELIGMLAHDGVLVQEQVGWRLTIDVDAISIPPTIHALLASRLERIAAADRRVLEIASVIGSDFPLGALRALADGDGHEVALSLNRLRRLELAQPTGAYVGDEPMWRFHHVLIRDVAYRRLLKSDRANLHERLADWVEAGGHSVAFDPDESIARHLEAAHTYRRELGKTDERISPLALRAARHYAASARRALDRDELVSAGTQAARGAALATADVAVHADLLLIGCEAFLSAGDVAAGGPLVDDLERIGNSMLAPWAACYRCQLIVYTDPERLPDIDARLHAAIDEFGRRRDHAGLAKAHRVRASARARLGRIGDCEQDLFEALIAARQSGDHRQITAALGAAPSAALWGPSPVPKAGGRCLDVVRMQRMTTAAPSLEATSLRHLAVLELLRGRPDKARKMLSDARHVVAELGLRHGLMETELFAGIIEAMEGDPAAAEPHFRTALEGLDALGVGADAGLAAALLARSVLAQGRVDEADRYASESERLAGRNLKTAIAWRAVRAEILAAQGSDDAAVSMARNAVAVAADTDLVLDHAEACLALSRVLAAAGGNKGAIDARDDAERLYAAKEVAATIGRTVRAATSETSPPTSLKTASTTSRLAVTNQSCEVLPQFIGAIRAHDVEGTLGWYADRFVYDDRRRISGDLVVGFDAMRRAIERVFAQYTEFEFRVLAVRGQRLHLGWERWSDDDGNETTSLYVNESDHNLRIEYHGRFDEDDFVSAYRALEERYYAGEGAAFAESGAVTTEWLCAFNEGDLDRSVEFMADVNVNQTRSGIPDRAAAGVGADSEEFAATFDSVRMWYSTVNWLSPHWGVGRMERAVVGREHNSWTRVLVFEIRNGRTSTGCAFDLADEDAAFAYAAERMPATASRLVLTNRCCEVVAALITAMQAEDANAAGEFFADELTYDDRRVLRGGPIAGRAEMVAAAERILGQFSRYEYRILAIRSERLALCWSRWSDDAGNASTTIRLFEIDGNRQIAYEGCFDEDDLENAYRELEQRYYAGDGLEFAGAGGTSTEWALALNRADFDMMFDDLMVPDFVIQNRSRSAFPDRCATEYRTTLEELAAMVNSSQSWSSVICWLSPTCTVARCEREAVGKNGEQHAWSFLIVFEFRDGRLAAMCEFELEDEDAAFAYAEERMRAATSRMAVTNRTSEVSSAALRALNAQDVDAVLARYANRFVYDDRRRLRGDPIEGATAMRAAVKRILSQYTHFDFHTLGVRGERLALIRSHWSDEAGNVTTYLHVYEIDDDGRVTYDGRFDEDDFEGAYRELERRHYAGEGAAYAQNGLAACEAMLALNRGDFDRLTGELSVPELQLENRSRSAFPDRSAADLSASLEQLGSMVATVRSWVSVARWLSPCWAITRMEREAVGADGERYAWTRLIVTRHRDGRFESMCEFDLEDEQAALAYAEEQVRATANRLPVTNLASQTTHALADAMRARDIDGAVGCYRDDYHYDDQRRLSGDPIRGKAGIRAAMERLLADYNRFELRTLAVRGERLYLFQNRMLNDRGYETTYIFVYEVDVDGQIVYEGRFDGDNFAGAYRQLERRYYAGEGTAFAAAGAVQTEYMVAFSQGDFDRMIGDLTDPGIRFENRSSSAFPDLSVAAFRTSVVELASMVSSIRAWGSAVCWVSAGCCVSRFEREAVGHDGEPFEWQQLIVAEFNDGRLASACQFDSDGEDAAFAYADKRVHAVASRLAVTNRARQTWELAFRAARDHDVNTMAGCYNAERLVFDDRRRLSGLPPGDLRTAQERILAQYTLFDGRTLAVRGENLHLGWTRWSNESGFETAYLMVHEIGDDGRFVYEARFDEADFEGAYRELERRYVAGNDPAFADLISTGTEWLMVLNEGDFDRLFRDLTDPETRVLNRSRGVFPERSTAELRASLEDLFAMVVSVRSWNSVEITVGATCCVVRHEREAVGPDGERYEWTRIYVFEAVDGRCTGLCEFDLNDEVAAFAYAEQRTR